MSSETSVQTPSIGNALRKALSLDAAGGMPLDMSQTVHPVVIVGDVRAALGSGVRSYANWRAFAGVAAQFSKVALEVVPTTATALKVYKVVPRRIWILSSVAQFFYLRLGFNTPPAVTSATPRQLNSRITGNGAGRLVGGTDGVAPNSGLSDTLGFVQANVPLLIELDPERSITPDPITAPSFIIEFDTVNTAVNVSMEWDEYFND